ncbi:unnamed protein product [Adineta steineri]|uniref:rhomboid protease n=1 Tax=Adineta steineri TaxID=433720 RepID=A0A815I955_9BILA|nr:unnamed protein product [Adineta steineri]CAF1361944.1 unnamed protein product [Adineta steineri]
MDVEHLETANDDPRWINTNNNFNAEEEYNDDSDHQPLLKQNIEYSPKKRVFIAWAETSSNSSINEHQNQPETEFQLSVINNQPTVALEQQPQKRKRYSWFILIVSVIQICVFIAELITNWVLTGSPIMNLSSNPLFGPSSKVLIRMGAGFTPCMHTIDNLTANSLLKFSCLNSTTQTYQYCTLKELCHFHDDSQIPNQWYRFIAPIFLHAGVIHIGMNIITQLLFGLVIERKIGTFRLIVIYFASGIFGLVLGSNFAPEGFVRIGCSGSVFGLIAVAHLDLLYNWAHKKHPIKDLIMILITTTIDLSIGLLPYIDNFSHAGGFFMGILLTLALLGAPTNLRKGNIIESNMYDYDKWYNLGRYRLYFSNRPKKWWIWWLVRFIAFVTVITLFTILIINFYTRMFKCSWCKYISCLPVNGWCDIGKL